MFLEYFLTKINFTKKRFTVEEKAFSDISSAQEKINTSKYIKNFVKIFVRQ
jgi:hypothetical protein